MRHELFFRVKLPKIKLKKSGTIPVMKYVSHAVGFLPELPSASEKLYLILIET